MNFKTALMIGLIPLMTFYYWDSEYKQAYDTAYYINLDVEADYKGFFVGGYYQSTFYSSQGFGFEMDNDIFEFRAGWKSDNVEIGFKHNCSHPLVSYLWQHPDLINLREGGWQEFYLKLSLEGVVE